MGKLTPWEHDSLVAYTAVRIEALKKGLPL